MDDIDIQLALNQMYSISCQVRGGFIHKFTDIEYLMDVIIRQLAFNDNQTYEKYIEQSFRSEISMAKKKAVFMVCVEKYERMYNKKFEVLFEKLNYIIDKRNKIAHWFMDTSQESIKLYHEKEKLRFITYGKDNQKKEEYFSMETIKKIEKDFHFVHGVLVEILTTIDFEKTFKSDF